MLHLTFGLCVTTSHEPQLDAEVIFELASGCTFELSVVRFVSRNKYCDQ
jgi:hypothetical protein